VSITITLTGDEANNLHDALDHVSNDMECRVDYPENLSKHELEMADIWKNMYDIAQRVLALIEAETVEKMIEAETVEKRADFEDDWLIFTDNPIGCTIAVHKSMAGRRANLAQSTVCEPREGVTRFGPGSLSLSMTNIDDLHFDVHHVHTLWDEGYLNDECIKIFGGAK
tara:strand:+ start:141 stop:647 length:507 start_codon:yes stop_codon:yes gene_type:complete